MLLFKVIFTFLVLYLVLSMGVFIRAKYLENRDRKKSQNSPCTPDARALENLLGRTVLALSNAIEAKDAFTHGHSMRVAEYAREIARRMGKSEFEQQQVYYAGLLHDVGKIRIPDRIIRIAGKLSDRDFSIMRLHPLTGYRILKGICPGGEIENAVKYHHERFDGKGYPENLSGSEIPEYARIICIADCYDAMTSDRSFRAVFPQSFVRGEMLSESGKQFDPEICRHMIDMIDDDTAYEMCQRDSTMKKILIVDDDPINLRIVEFMLKKEQNYVVFTAKSGAECLEKIRDSKFDLILLDVEMPEMNGFVTLAEVKELDDLVPVIFMTVDNDLDTLTRAKNMGVVYYLMKPFYRQELMEAVGNVFQQELEG